MTAVDPLYAGKEQSLVKHEVLRRYLETFAHKVGAGWSSITYIDGFSGPWNSVSAELQDSSFAIALTELRRARETLRQRKALRLRCFFVEQDRGAYVQLDQYARAQTDVEIRTANVRLECAIPEIVEFLSEDKQTFAFTLIDPTGWTGFALDTIRPLIQFQPGEVLVNFMTSFITRFVEVDEVRPQLAATFGSSEALDRIRGLQGLDRTDACVFEYCLALKSVGRFEFVSPAVVLQPTKDREHFHLIYATRKAIGLKVFKDAERKAMDIMEKARATAEERKRGTGGQRGLFAPEQMPESAYYVSLRDRYTSFSRKAVVELLQSKQRVAYDEAWAVALNRPLVWESDLKAWIKEWENAGLVRIEGMANERTPKVGRQHLLSWMGK